MTTQELIIKIEEAIRKEVPSTTVVRVLKYGRIVPSLQIKMFVPGPTINNVPGQFIQRVLLILYLEDMELRPIFRGIARKIDPNNPREKYLAQVGIKIPFRKPAQEEEAVIRACARFAKRWVEALKENVDVLMHQDLVDYKQFLNS